MGYNMEKFEGAVVLKDWMLMPGSDRSTKGFCGIVSILEASQMTGFDVGKNEANWIARIESDDGDESVNIPGCQVRGVLQGPNYRLATSPEFITL